MNTNSDPVAGLVDTTRYPLDDLASPDGQELVDRCRSELQASGACQLPGFISPQGLQALVTEAAGLALLAFRQDDLHNVYFEDVDDSLPEDHPNRLLQHTSSAAVAWDEIPEGSGIRELYESEQLLEFIRNALGKEKLYRNADPLGACTVVVYREGDELGWHFDNAEFAVTLMLQRSESGGDFEYVPRIRSHEEENHERIQQLLQGSDDGVIHFPS